MPRKDKNRYDELKQDLLSAFGQVAAGTLEGLVQQVELQGKKAISAVYDFDKIQAVDSIVRCYANGFLWLVGSQNLSGPGLVWIALNYKDFFNTGIDTSLPGLHFGSHMPNGSSYFKLELCSRDGRLDRNFIFYKEALEKYQTPDPKLDYHVTVAYYDHQRERRNKLIIEVKV